MKEIVTADRSREAARHLRLPLWRWCVRVTVALFVVGNAIDWFATIFVLGIVISNWTLIIGDLISGEAGLTDVAWIAGTLTLTVLAIWIVAAVVSADKRTVLYLRRFHAHGPQARMRGTLDSGLRRRYRVVALYDGLFQPLEVPPLERWLNRIVLPLVAVALVLGSSLFVYLAPLVSLGAPIDYRADCRGLSSASLPGSSAGAHRRGDAPRPGDVRRARRTPEALVDQAVGSRPAGHRRDGAGRAVARGRRRAVAKCRCARR